MKKILFYLFFSSLLLSKSIFTYAEIVVGPGASGKINLTINNIGANSIDGLIVKVRNKPDFITSIVPLSPVINIPSNQTRTITFGVVVTTHVTKAEVGKIELIATAGNGELEPYIISTEDIRIPSFVDSGIYLNKTLYNVFWHGSLAWGDYDNDGDLDLIVGGYEDIVNSPYPYTKYTIIYKNNSGEFVELQRLPGGVFSSVSWTDIDNDGDLDIAVTGEDDNKRMFKIFKNNSGEFIEDTNQKNLVGMGDSSIAFGDYDLDGDLDLAMTGYTGSEWISKIYKNQSGVLIEDANQNILKVGLGSLTWADVDNDGDLDLILTGDKGGFSNYSITKLYKNNSGILQEDTKQFYRNIGGNLIPFGEYEGMIGGAIAVGDYDSDGDLDLAMAGFIGYNYVVRIYKNEDGVFIEDISQLIREDQKGITPVISTKAKESVPAAMCKLYSLAWGDYDNDGKLDLAVFGNYQSHLYKNINGILTEDETQKLLELSNVSIAWGDYDNDKDLDLAIKGYNRNQGWSIKIYDNNEARMCNILSSPPNSLNNSYSEGKLTLSWEDGSDAETPTKGLYYNIRVGTGSGKENIVSGKYGSPLFGNYLLKRKSLTLNLPPKVYYWAVQTIDTGLRASEWSKEQIYEFTPPTITNPQAIPDIVNIGEQVKFTAKVIDEGSGVKSVTIDLSSIGGSSDQLMNDTGAGTYTYQTTIPNSVSWGIKNLVITANDSASNISKTTITLRVINPKITSVIPTSGTMGTKVTIQGEGYLSTEQIRIDFGTTKSIAITAANGLSSFTATFTINSQSMGLKTIAVTGLLSNALATTTFTIIDSIPPVITNPKATPEIVNVGTSVKFTATIIDTESGVKSVTIDISSIGGSSDQLMNDTGAGTYTYQTTIPNSVSWGIKNLVITANDSASNISKATITLRVINPKITSVIPTSGTIGTIVMLKGEGYLPTEQIRINFGTTKSIAITAASGTGSFTVNFTVDSQSLGIKTIIATGFLSNALATTTFTIIDSIPPVITNPKATPEIVNVGTSVKFTATIIDTESGVKSVTIDISSIGGSSDQLMNDTGAGTYTYQTTIPNSVSWGIKNLVITANDSTSNISKATITLRVINPKITSVIPTSGTIGTIVMLKGEGYLPTEQIRINFGTTKSIAITAACGTGSFTVNFTVDSQSLGIKTIIATGFLSNALATTTFTIIDSTPPVITNPKATPEIVNVGTSVKFTATVSDKESGVKSVTIDLTPINCPANQPMYDNGTNGDEVIGDNIYTYVALIPGDVSLGQKKLLLTAIDVANNVTTATIKLKIGNPPVLSWVDENGYKTEGIEPNTGINTTIFTYKVRYCDEDNTSPDSYSPKLYVLRGGEVVYQKKLYKESGNDYVTGIVYIIKLPLVFASEYYSYYFEAKNTLGVFAIGTPTTIQPDPLVTGLNYPPRLRWVGNSGYVSDGLEPETGNFDTAFNYCIKYSDLNADPPKEGYPILYVYKSDAFIGTKTLSYLYGSFTSGAVYGATYTFKTTGIYQYKFEARDKKDLRCFTSLKSGPIVSNAPTLEWIGEEGYNSDGLEPEVGAVNLTAFTYKVSYKDIDNDLPDNRYPVVHIFKAGKEISGSPYRMEAINPNDLTYNDGKGYTLTKIFDQTGSYTYQFEAYDYLRIKAFGSPTNIFSSPAVSVAPTLKWVNAEGFGTDGVNPDPGQTTNKFTYKILYTDVNNLPPVAGYPKIYIYIGGVLISPGYIIRKETEGSYSAGVVYSFNEINLPYASEAYSYYFEAKNSNNVVATGEPTTLHSGPKVEGLNYPPLLFSTREKEYYNDGVEPDATSPGTFTFHVAYLDMNVNPPADGYPAVIIYKDNKPYGLGTYSMTYLNGGYFKGATYSTTIILNDLGIYKYKFYAKDNKGRVAVGPFTIFKTGPKVSHAPKLEWAGSLNFQTDGLDPEEGIVSQTYFTFKVKYKDEDGDAPATDYPKICIINNETLVGKVKMLVESGNDYKTGKIYYCILRLGTVSDKYKYYFEAKDTMDVLALGTPTLKQSGPIVKPKPSASPETDQLQILESLEIFNYPNPHSGKTALCAKTNLVGVSIDMQVAVYNIVGELIWEKRESVPSSIDGIAEIPWDAKNIASGIYLYRVTVSYNGKTMQKISKMAITR